MNKKEEKKVSDEIKIVVSELMDRVMNKVLVTDPFIKENHQSAKPLYAALVPDEIFKGSHFERRFVTPFGGVWEKLAYVVANGTIVADGSPRQIANSSEAKRLYFGEDFRI